MGKFNVKSVNQYKHCFICNSEIEPVLGNVLESTFDYVCSSCNPRVLIKVTELVLSPTLLSRLSQDSDARKSLALQINQCPYKEYEISVSELLYHIRFLSGEVVPQTGTCFFNNSEFLTDALDAGSTFPAINGEQVPWRFYIDKD